MNLIIIIIITLKKSVENIKNIAVNLTLNIKRIIKD